MIMPDQQQQEYCLRQLWGGAAHAEIPSSFVDLSDLRQVPDHQECWMDDDAGAGPGAGDNNFGPRSASARLLVFELLEYRESVQDSDAARFYFADLAEANGSGAAQPQEGDGDASASSSSSSFTEIPASSLPLAPRCTAAASNYAGGVLLLGAGTQRVRMGRDHDWRGGRPREVRTVKVEVAVLRLPARHTDVLITLSAPVGREPGADTSGPPSAGLLSEPFRRAVGTFEIVDGSLLG